ncbi:hypothetical protein HanRHA438_Chr15g0714211 [Helianthus annuus]|nr:hypothetical protein HanRHA438_Chr15g0714211 [Helianthus annuus]
MAVGPSSPANSFGPHALNCLKLKVGLGASVLDSSEVLLAFSFSSLTICGMTLAICLATREAIRLSS